MLDRFTSLHSHHPGLARTRLACRRHLTLDQQIEGPQAFIRSRPCGWRGQQERNRRQSGRSSPPAFRPCDLLVNNAGIFPPKAFIDYTEEDYHLVMNTNVASFFYMTQQVIAPMKMQNSGHVVNISAVIADQPSSGALLAVLSKSPMPAVSKALALEFAANNIRFNTVSPGVVSTPLHAQDDHTALAKFHPLARMGEVSDIVDAILYLQNATFVTGENIRVDGGVHAGR